MENEITNATWIDESWQKVLDILNQPFIIAIMVALILGVFAFIICRDFALGKKSVKEQNKKLDLYGKSEEDLKKDIVKKKDELVKEKDNYIKKVGEDFTKFYNENEDFRNFVINSLQKINNKGVKELLEEYKNGKGEETKDN